MKSCKQCRDAKRRCIYTQHGSSGPSCIRCQHRQLPCSRSRRLAVQPVLAPASSFTKPLDISQKIEDFLADDGSIALLVQEYMYKIHGRPHSIFHAPTLWRDIREGRASKALILSLCAMGAHLSDQPTLKSLRSLLTSESQRLLQADLNRVCLETVQTCILVANLCVANGNSSAEFLFFRTYHPKLARSLYEHG